MYRSDRKNYEGSAMIEQFSDNITIVFEGKFGALLLEHEASAHAHARLQNELDRLDTTGLVDFFRYAATDDEFIHPALFSVHANIRDRKRSGDPSDTLDQANETITGIYWVKMDQAWHHDENFRYRLPPANLQASLERLFEYQRLCLESRVTETSIRKLAEEYPPEEIVRLINSEPPITTLPYAMSYLNTSLIGNYLAALKSQRSEDMARYVAALLAVGEDWTVALYKDWKPTNG
jgi:hypothetical protein